jgi:hypothetical protein
MKGTESQIISRVRQVIAESSPSPSEGVPESATELSSLGYARGVRAELRRKLEEVFGVLESWDAYDRESMSVADIERLVLDSLTIEGTAPRERHLTTGLFKGPDLRAHMRADGR